MQHRNHAPPRRAGAVAAVLAFLPSRPLLFALVAATATMTQTTVDGANAPGTERGSPQVRLESLAGGPRYTLVVPGDYTGEQAVPLVLALHFGGTATAHYGRAVAEQLVEPALRPLGAVAVAPDCTSGSWAHPDCEAGALRVLDRVESQFRIDRRRVLVTGYSMGGIGTWELAARHPERFTAAVVMAGRPSPQMAQAQWRVPLYVIHARDDEILPLEPTEGVVQALRARAVAVELVVLDGVTHYETHRFVAPLAAALPWLRAAWAED